MSVTVLLENFLWCYRLLCLLYVLVNVYCFLYLIVVLQALFNSILVAFVVADSSSLLETTLDFFECQTSQHYSVHQHNG